MLLESFLFGLLPALVSSAGVKSSTAACNAGSPPIALGQRQNVTLSHTNRTFMYFLPEKYNQSQQNPLILSFHGASRTADWQADLDRLTDPFFNDDHVVVYPQAEQYGINSSYIYWQGSPNATADDVAYTSDVLNEIQDTLCIDPTRIYATGKSQGGGFVGYLACDSEASQRIAAFAPVSGAFYTTGAVSDLTSCGDPQTLANACHPGRSGIPLLDFHGGNDTTISINGGLRNGGCLPDVRAYVKEWASRDDLSTSVAPAAAVAINGSAKLYQYGGGKNQGLVTFVYDGDHVNHDWPATINNTDNWAHQSGPASFNASSLILEFFRKYSLPSTGNDTGSSNTTSSTAGTSTATGTTTATQTASSVTTATATGSAAATTTTGTSPASTSSSTPPASGASPLFSASSILVIGVVSASWLWNLL